MTDELTPAMREVLDRNDKPIEVDLDEVCDGDTWYYSNRVYQDLVKLALTEFWQRHKQEKE